MASTSNTSIYNLCITASKIKALFNLFLIDLNGGSLKFRLKVTFPFWLNWLCSEYGLTVISSGICRHHHKIQLYSVSLSLRAKKTNFVPILRKKDDFNNLFLEFIFIGPQVQ